MFFFFDLDKFPEICQKINFIESEKLPIGRGIPLGVDGIFSRANIWSECLTDSESVVKENISEHRVASRNAARVIESFNPVGRALK